MVSKDRIMELINLILNGIMFTWLIFIMIIFVLTMLFGAFTFIGCTPLSPWVMANNGENFMFWCN